MISFPFRIWWRIASPFCLVTNKVFLRANNLWGWGFAQFWHRFFSFFHLPEKRNTQTGFCTDFSTFWRLKKFRKTLVSVKFVSAILGRKRLRQFMDAWKKCVLSAGKTYVHKIPRFRGGGVFWVGGGGSADFIFMGARIFLKSRCSRVTQNAENLWKNLRRPNAPALVGTLLHLRCQGISKYLPPP